MLTDAQLKRVRPKAKAYKLTDRNGLYLYVPTRGRPRWRFDYRLEGKRRTASLGVLGDVSLEQARKRLANARALVADETDPVREKRERRLEERSAASFGLLAEEWYRHRTPHLAKQTTFKKRWMLDSFILPAIGQLPLKRIAARDVLPIIKQLEQQGLHETARRARQTVSEILRYGVATLRVPRDVTPDLAGALLPYQPQHRAALTDPREVAKLLRAIDSMQDTPQLQSGLWLLALTFVRPGELQRARWEEIDEAAAVWHVPALRTKQRSRHVVPLSRQALEHLAKLRVLCRGSAFVLPTPRTIARPLSNAAFTAALARIGYSSDLMTPHGFRALARTLLDEQLQEPPDAIEAQLGHATRGALGDTYNRSRYLAHRKAMMARWADYLTELATKGRQSQ